MTSTRVLGVDPGLGTTGWGLITVDGSHLSAVGCGVITTNTAETIPARLRALHEGLAALLGTYHPAEAAVEEVFVNRNGATTLKLGYARGVALLALALAGVPVAEYAARTVKQAVVGTGAAAKVQVGVMVRHLLPGADCRREDAADALAIAICHAHHRGVLLAGRPASPALSGRSQA